MKNPLQAVLLATEIQKILGIHEELKDEDDPEKAQKRALQRLQEMNDEERKTADKKIMKTYQENAPAFLESIEKNFP